MALLSRQTKEKWHGYIIGVKNMIIIEEIRKNELKLHSEKSSFLRLAGLMQPTHV